MAYDYEGYEQDEHGRGPANPADPASSRNKGNGNSACGSLALNARSTSKHHRLVLLSPSSTTFNDLSGSGRCNRIAISRGAVIPA